MSALPLVSVRDAGALVPGLRCGGVVVEAAAAARLARLAADLAGLRSTRDVLGLGPRALDELGEAARSLASDGGVGLRPYDEAALGPPVPDPEKVVCVGLNYVAHVEEVAMDAPLEAPVLFAKWANALAGPRDAIVRPPAGTAQLDYEGELCAVIGRTCRDVAEEDALACVFGYTAMDDVSARDLQLSTSQWTAGKAPDGFAPCGPSVVPAADVGDPQALRVTTTVSGELRQDAPTALMMRPVARLVSEISRLVTLRPGDLIATGTPAGVAMGQPSPPWLRVGDVVEVTIAGVGTLRNEVAA